MNKINDTLIIPDVQSDLDEHKISINKVGIKSIKHPVEFDLNKILPILLGHLKCMLIFLQHKKVLICQGSLKFWVFQYNPTLYFQNFNFWDQR